MHFLLKGRIYFCDRLTQFRIIDSEFHHLRNNFQLRSIQSLHVAVNRLLAKHGSFVITTEYERPPGLTWDEDRYQGDAYGSYGWGCNVVELELDRTTWEVRPTKVTAVVEIGKAIHPVMAAGQVQGGTAQGVGWALIEEVVMRDGRMANAQLTNYIIPTPMDTPPIDTVILEQPYKYGPYGAKGVGEMPIDGPAAAVVNAIRHAGFDVRSIPATPERLMSAARIKRGAGATSASPS